ncbi:MAG: sodium:calcium antiporter [Actinomycetota bacterium]
MHVQARGVLLRPSLILAVLVPVPGLVVRFGLVHLPILAETALFAAAIVGAAFLLSWAAEVAQLDISQTLAIAVLALIAVLPEYAVDLYLAYSAGQGGKVGEANRHLAIANMTGANRLLIGLGWAAVVLVFWFKAKRRSIQLRPEQRTDVGFLLLATLWAFSIPIRGQLWWPDLLVLGTLFVAYIVRAVREEVEEPELIGAAAAIGALPRTRRRVTTALLFVYAAFAILMVAEHFAEGLKTIGLQYGISEFFLIQWVAPLASEAPEMIIAILFTLRLRAQAGLGTLISSKVNQWTLLVGTLWLVFGIGGGEAGPGSGFLNPLHLDGIQREEVLLTAAQSLFAVAVIANLSISRWEAIALLVLFLGQFAFTQSEVRIGFSITYIVLAVSLMLARADVRRNLLRSMRHTVPWLRTGTEPS